MGMHEKIGTSDDVAMNVQNLLFAAGYKVDNVQGRVTRAFVETLKRFQRDSMIPGTGIVDNLTMEALEFAAVCEPAAHEVRLRGKVYLLSEGDYRALKRKVCAEFKRTAYHGMRMRVMEARGVYDSMKALNNDQCVVSWLIEATARVELPKESVVKGAETQIANVERALKAGDIKLLHATIPCAETVINQALHEIRVYRKAMIEGGGNWVTGLEITKTAAFTTLGILAGPAVASVGMGAVATGFVAGAGVSAAESISTEIGKGLAGSSKGIVSASGTVLRDSFIGGSVGALARGKYAEKIVKGISGKIASRITAGWARSVSKSTLAKFTGRVLQNAANNALEGAMGDVIGQFKSKPEKLTAEKFFDNLAKNAVVGGVMGEFDKILEPTAKDMVKKMPSSARKEISRGLSKDLPDSDLEQLLLKSGSEPVKKALEKATEKVLSAAKGTESPRELQRRIIEATFDKSLNQALIKIATNNSRRGR